jgi:hypothetical protein
MIARAGGLDQGNIILNLADVAKNLPPEQALYLAGSAINSMLDAGGNPDPKLGAQAMREAVDLWRSGEASSLADSDGLHAQTLYALAQSRKLMALQIALEQRYGLSSGGL